MEIFFGFALGFMSIAHTYVAMSSTEKDRGRAVSLVSLSVQIGHAAGPLLMSFFALLAYPGYEMFGGLHLNLYTVSLHSFVIKYTAFRLRCT
jgi:MFS family permease